MHYLLFYEVVPDYLERRSEFRAEHLALAREACLRGELILAGAFANPTDGATFLFQAESPETAANFAAADPVVRNGLVTRWWIREWHTVIGELAANPLPVTAS